MARSLERSVRFTKPGSYILNMLLFLLLVGAVVFYLSPYSPEPSTLLVDAFNANIALNGLILGVLLTFTISVRLASFHRPFAGWKAFARRSTRTARACPARRASSMPWSNSCRTRINRGAGCHRNRRVRCWIQSVPGWMKAARWAATLATF